MIYSPITRRRQGSSDSVSDTANPTVMGGGSTTAAASHMLRKPKMKSTGGGIGPLAVLILVALYVTLLTGKMSSDSGPKLDPSKEEPKDSEHFLITLTKDRTYTGVCKNRYLNNRTWGQSVAKYVDKLAAKDIVHKLNVPNLKVVPTIAFYDDTNISTFTMDVFLSHNSGNGVIIKPTHSSGGVAKIYNDTYHCFKKCRKLANFTKAKKPQHQPMQISANVSEAYRVARTVMEIELEGLYQKAAIETQYQFIPRGIIVEKRLHVEDMMEYHWWVVNGQPVFVCLRCNYNGISAGSYFTSRFRRLSIKMEGLPGCRADMEQPKTWNRMVEMVKTLSLKLPKGIIRIDLYASDREIYFSEFTYTSNGCRYYYDPLVADAFLYGALYGIFKPSQLTPAFIEAAINQRFWYIVPYMRHMNSDDNKTHNALRDVAFVTAHPNDWTACRRAKFQTTTNATENCFKAVTSFDKKYPIRCVGVTPNDLVVVGQWRIATYWATSERVDWHWAFGVAAALFIMVVTGAGSQRKETQISAILVYLAAVTLYKYVQPNCMGFFSPDSLWRTAADSFRAFAEVHPMTSQIIGWSHIVTYWFPIAAWNAKTVRGVLFWYFLYESVTPFLNEYLHLTEEDRQLRCIRVTFIHISKQYAVNELVRAYLLPPFFVYLYLLPKLILQWTPLGETL